MEVILNINGMAVPVAKGFDFFGKKVTDIYIYDDYINIVTEDINYNRFYNNSIISAKYTIDDII